MASHGQNWAIVTQTITLQELLVQIEKARQRMSAKNPHRLLFRQCEDALIQLAQRVWELSAILEHNMESPNAPTRPHAVGRILITG